MLENNDQDRYYCSFCGSNLPEGFVEKLKNNSGVLICEQCGAEITKENFSTHESLIEVEEKEACYDDSILEVKHETSLEDYSTVERYCLVMRSFMCRRIYDFFKKIKYSVRVYEDKGLNSFQLKVLARDFRKWLKKTSFEVEWIYDPISVSFDEYLKFFQTFQAHLRYKKFYRTQYLDFIRDSLQLVMGLIVGRVQASSLSGIDREIYDDLKRYLCFIVNDDARDDFKYNLTVFLSWYIYRKVKTPLIDRNFVKSDGTLSEEQVTKLANTTIRFLKEELLKQKLINKFRGADKRKFKKNFTEFQYSLKNDQIYRNVVFDYSCWLIRVVLDLIRGKHDSAELSGIKLEVLKHLRCRKLFVKDASLSVEFKRNILIMLSRVLNLNFKKLEKSSGLKASQMMLKESAINALVSELRTVIGGKKEINCNLLGNLKDITLLDFRSEYGRFQSNLKSNWIYSESFSLKLRNLIRDVFRLISEPPDRSLLNDYEKAMFDDLVAYNLDAFLSEKDGEKREKVKASSKKPEKPPNNQKKEYLRTYKVGLRVPESLLEEQNELVKKSEILRFLRKRQLKELKKGITGDFNGFRKHKNLITSSSRVVNDYKKIYDRFKDLDPREIVVELSLAEQKLKRLLDNKNPALLSSSFKKSDVPKFVDASKPSPAQISVHDYQYLANNSLKMVCSYLNDVAEEFIDQIPPDKDVFVNVALKKAQSKPSSGRNRGKTMKKDSLISHPEMAVANLVGRFGNLDQVAFSQMADAMDAHRDTIKKLNRVKRLLFSASLDGPDFNDAIPILTSYYSVPNHLINYLSRGWKVDSKWVRNLLVGWRRRLDKFLPLKFQVEQLTPLFSQIAEFCKKHAQCEAELKIIEYLQKERVLHLISKVDLSPLFSGELREHYFRLKSNIPRFPEDLKTLINMLSFKLDVNSVVASANRLKKKVELTMLNLDPTSQSSKNCRAFIKKIDLLVKCTDLREFQPVFNQFFVGNRFTGAASNLFKNVDFIKKARVSRLFTALRGISALTFAKYRHDATVRFESAFTPENCLTRPFNSEKRKKKRLPATLLSPKYVVLRKKHPSVEGFLNNKDATALLKNSEPIWLGIPLYSPVQSKEFSDVVKSARNRVVRKGVFWFQLLPSDKVIESLKKGAVLRSIRLNVPRRPTAKIVVDLTLSSEELRAFSHSGRFLSAWDKKYGSIPFPKSEYMGSDFNRIGTNLVAAATPQEEIDLTLVDDLTGQFSRAFDKLEKYRKLEIPNVQKKLDSGKGTPSLRGRWRTQITLLHQKRKRVMKEYKRMALMCYLYAGYRTGARYFAWDGSQGISTRGKKGTLATAITYMPNRLGLFEEFSAWAGDLKYQGILPNYEFTELVSPFTSQICGACFFKTGEQKRTLKATQNYDIMTCKSCGKELNRHSNAARVSAQLLLRKHQAKA